MQQFEYTIKDPIGIHARPAGVLIKTAGAFKCDIDLYAKEHKISLKGSIFQLLGLGIRCGDRIRITCSGEDEILAVQQLQAALQENL